jgi:hypothetical protein
MVVKLQGEVFLVLKENLNRSYLNMKPKKLIGRLSDEPFLNVKGMKSALLEYLGFEDESCRVSAMRWTIRNCTLQDYEGCKNYKGDKKIPICYDCPYRGNRR